MNMFELVAAFMTAAATTITAVLTALRYRHERALERRAFVRATIIEVTQSENGQSRNSYRLKLHNAGKARATNLRLLLDGQEARPYEAVGAMAIMSRIPHELEPGGEALLRLTLFLGGDIPTKLTVLWDDLAGSSHCSSLDLSV
ncbi:MAG: hypothetical protein J7453_11335 [Thermomicrobium sp.]|jgi:hypothetical protein|uniref:hypothetical protein n=1 Tax=Thermomicrobium sp. TaxID=1969469 RepID=UPI001B11332D|nr:hypothetical protein [Thermomicrobium sp.]MBO9360443.1 hypothetical protein [Thermomicrobium sp.]MBO9387016.1 hypothetical protein [Thermomicrobium sp.]